ncbi:hypothetical protein ACFL0B_08665 [Thermodesulfobacteriota bacterium]
MEYYTLRELSEMARIPLHILRRDAKLLFPEKQSQGVSSTYNTNECFELYLYAHLVGVKKMALEAANSVIKILRPYLRKKGLMPEGKKPEPDEYRDLKEDDGLGQVYTIPNAPIVYPTKISIFEAIIVDPEDNQYNDFSIIANRERSRPRKPESKSEGPHISDVLRISEYIHLPPEGYEINYTHETILPVSQLLNKFNECKRQYDAFH